MVSDVHPSLSHCLGRLEMVERTSREISSVLRSSEIRRDRFQFEKQRSANAMLRTMRRNEESGSRRSVIPFSVKKKKRSVLDYIPQDTAVEDLDPYFLLPLKQRYADDLELHFHVKSIEDFENISTKTQYSEELYKLVHSPRGTVMNEIRSIRENRKASQSNSAMGSFRKEHIGHIEIPRLDEFKSPMISLSSRLASVSRNDERSRNRPRGLSAPPGRIDAVDHRII